MLLSIGAERKQKSGEYNMPGMTERKRDMRGETKTARGDYGKKGYGHGGDVKKYGGGGAVKQAVKKGLTADKGKMAASKPTSAKGKTAFGGPFGLIKRKK